MDYDPTPTMIWHRVLDSRQTTNFSSKRLCEEMSGGSPNLMDNLARFKFSGRMDRKSLDLVRRTCLHGPHQYVGYSHDMLAFFLAISCFITTSYYILIHIKSFFMCQNIESTCKTLPQLPLPTQNTIKPPKKICVVDQPLFSSRWTEKEGVINNFDLLLTNQMENSSVSTMFRKSTRLGRR